MHLKIIKLTTFRVVVEVSLVRVIIQYKVCFLFSMFVHLCCVIKPQVADSTRNLIPFTIMLGYCYHCPVRADVNKCDVSIFVCSVDHHLKYCGIVLCLR